MGQGFQKALGMGHTKVFPVSEPPRENSGGRIPHSRGSAVSMPSAFSRQTTGTPVTLSQQTSEVLPRRRASFMGVSPNPISQGMSINNTGLEGLEQSEKKTPKQEHADSNRKHRAKRDHLATANETFFSAEKRERARILAGTPTSRTHNIKMKAGTDFTNDKPKPEPR
jgi:hypothetical protein